MGENNLCINALCNFNKNIVFFARFAKKICLSIRFIYLVHGFLPVNYH